MSDRERCADFMMRLDALLAAGNGAPALRTGDADDMRLALGLELPQLDLAGESLVREGLLRALGERRARRGSSTFGAPVRRVKKRTRLPRLAAAAALTIAAAIGVLAIASPRTLAAIAETVGGLLGKRIVAHSREEALDAVNAFRYRYDEGLYWGLQTTYGVTGGDVTRGMKPYSRLYSGIGPLVRDARIPVLLPTVWPEHLPEALRFQQAWLNPDGSVWIEFCVGQWAFMLSQTPIRDKPDSEWTFALDYDHRDTTQAEPIETVTYHDWDGVRVAWHQLRGDLRRQKYRWALPHVAGGPSYGSLKWEKDGIRYVLDGQNMTLDWAGEIWRSLEPVER
jgi:hypothetical protein